MSGALPRQAGTVAVESEKARLNGLGPAHLLVFVAAVDHD